MILDCFMFFNELDLLEIRLNSLAHHVDKFILCECPVTFSGRPKSLYFDMNRKRFRDFDIEALVVEDYKGYITSDPWVMEKHQREYMMNAIQKYGLDCTVLISDLDEFPDLRDYKLGSEGSFRQRLYYYYLNVFTGKDNWRGSVAVLKGNIKTLNRLRNRRWRLPTVGGGWHFSTVGNTDQIIEKIEAYAHQEYNIPEIKNKVAERRQELTELYGRDSLNGTKVGKFRVEDPIGLGWLLENRGRYAHMFYEQM